jgi:glycosyltransferase involved in cell wall biosynthesis
VKLAVVVQRYGADINGGAELHARYIAEMLARRHRVEVLTTCAHDYVTWKAHYPAGTETVNGVAVRRFAVAHERDPHDFGDRSRQVFEHRHSIADELAWLDSEGPTSPELIDYVGAQADAFDFFLFFSYRYYHAYHGVRRVPHKAILVPTAERDAALGLAIFGPVFRAARALMYNSPEERALIQAASGNTSVPGVVVGIGSDLPRETSAERFRRKFSVAGPFVIYVGRIDQNKGCAELFDYFSNYRPRLGQQLTLLLAGTSLLPIPDHPRIRHLGFISDRDKFDGIAASEALMMPSRFESLSMVALEAWGLGRPVLANGRCDVLRGQTIRSRAGLYYDNFPEFAEALFTLTTNRPLNQAFGENGRRFYDRHYAWPVIQRKYEDMLAQLARAGSSPVALDPLPGWLGRRRKTLPAAQSVVDALAKGPVAVDEPAAAAEARSAPGGHAPRPSPVGGGRQAIRSGPHGRGQRQVQAGRPKAAQGAAPGGGNGGGNAAPPAKGGAPGQKGGHRDRQEGRRGAHRQGRHRRPPRRNG